MLFKQARLSTIIISGFSFDTEGRHRVGGCEQCTYCCSVSYFRFLSRWLRLRVTKCFITSGRPGSHGDSWLGARKGDSCNPGKLQGKCHYVPTATHRHRQRWTEHNLTTIPIQYIDTIQLWRWMKRNDCKNINHEKKPLRWRGSEVSTEPQCLAEMRRSPTLH